MGGYKNKENYAAMLAGGAANIDAFDQFSSTDGVVNVDLYAFIPVNGDVTFTQLEEGGKSVNDKKLAATYYQNITYMGRFNKIEIESGEIIGYKIK